MEEEKSDIRWKVENIVSFRLSDKNKKIKIKKNGYIMTYFDHYINFCILKIN